MPLILVIVMAVAVGLVWFERKTPLPVIHRDAGILPQLWDVLFGTVLIGGGPLVGLFLPTRLLWPTVSERIANVFAAASCILALITWIYAIHHRCRRRGSPRWLLGIEIVIAGLFGIAYFCVIGMATYTIQEFP